MNRKLIRPNLADVKEKVEEKRQKTDAVKRPRDKKPHKEQAKTASHQQTNQRKKMPLQIDTNAEIFYYRKQIEAHTPMTIVLQDGERIEGAIEWYDRDALKIVRKNAPNVLLLRHSIKYMFKSEDEK